LLLPTDAETTLASGLKVSLNGAELVTVAAEGLNIIEVRVHGDRKSPTFACLDVSGGMYGVDEAERKHLVWECERELRPGDSVSASFFKDGATSAVGRTLKELFPEYQQPHGPPRPPNELLGELTARPLLRGHYCFAISEPSGRELRSQTRGGDDSFGLSVIWNWVHPERARVWLTSNSLEQVLNREIGTKHLTLDLNLGEQITLRVVSEPGA